MKRRSPYKDDLVSSGRPRLGIILSLALHAAVISILLAVQMLDSSSASIVAAREGEGGEGSGDAIQVGVTDASSILGFTQRQTVSYAGDSDDAINNMRLESVPREDADADALLPPTDRVTDPSALKTDRPVVNQQERIFTGRDERGRSTANTIQQGRTFGSPQPAAFKGGVAVGIGSGFGSGTGLPGGSDYGGRLQQALRNNYNPPENQSADVVYIFVVAEIGRNGQVLSANFRQRSNIFLVDKAVERALRSQLPPFPDNFLPGRQSATAELWFRYPK
ncbi:MAG TPA: TonB C-terminal domain-containing protein [Blastocatellia bacterium]|nr:TonB C-terminal domain-containing protein [Blastocatellia bacterium]